MAHRASTGYPGTLALPSGEGPVRQDRELGQEVAAPFRLAGKARPCPVGGSARASATRSEMAKAGPCQSMNEQRENEGRTKGGTNGTRDRFAESVRVPFCFFRPFLLFFAFFCIPFCF